MTSSERIPIWLNPQRFWEATKNMKPEQADQLMNRISELAERRETDALRQYDFIIVGRLPHARKPS